MQSSHAGADVITAGRRRRGAPPRSLPATGRRQPGVRRARDRYSRGPARFVMGVVVVIAVATATFGVQAYVRAGHQQARITTLQAEVAVLEQRIASDEHAAAGERRHVSRVAAQTSSARRALARFNWALQSVPSEAQVAGVRNEFAAYAACIPQLQREIAGLSVSWKVNPGKASISFFKLSSNAPISASCASALTSR